MLQFLIEALLISLMGCAIGIFFSWGTLRIISGVGGEDANYALSVGVVWIAIVFSIGIGLSLESIRRTRRLRRSR